MSVDTVSGRPAIGYFSPRIDIDADEVCENLQQRGAPFDHDDPENIALALGEQCEGQTIWVDACAALRSGNEHAFCSAVLDITAAYCQREAAKRAKHSAAEVRMFALSRCEDF